MKKIRFLIVGLLLMLVFVTALSVTAANDSAYDTYSGDYIAETGGDYYLTLDDAIASAESGATVTLLSDASVECSPKVIDDKYTALVVIDKNLDIDLAGHTIRCAVDYDHPIYAIFMACSDARVSFTDSVGGGSVITDAHSTLLYMFWSYGASSMINIYSGSYLMLSENPTNTPGALAYAGNSNFSLLGGSFYSSSGNIFMSNDEIFVETDGGVELVSAAAQVSGKPYAFHSFFDALDAAEAGDTITLFDSVLITEDTTIDLADVTVDGGGAFPAFRIINGATLTVKGGRFLNTDYLFVLGALDASSSGALIIEGGGFHAATSVASVTKGSLAVSGGEFFAERYDGTYDYLINCIDSAYINGEASVSITGGRFYKWNPQNNGAEGDGTSFVADGFIAVTSDDEYYKVIDAYGVDIRADASLKYDDGDAGMHNSEIRYGYNITLPEGVTLDRISWSFGPSSDNLARTYDATNIVYNSDGSVTANVLFELSAHNYANFLFVKINVEYFDEYGNSYVFGDEVRAESIWSVANWYFENYTEEHFTAFLAATLGELSEEIVHSEWLKFRNYAYIISSMYTPDGDEIVISDEYEHVGCEHGCVLRLKSGYEILYDADGYAYISATGGEEHEGI